MPETNPKPQAEHSNWTLATRRLLERRLPLKNLLPDRQPVLRRLVGLHLRRRCDRGPDLGRRQRSRAGLLRAAVVASVERRPLREQPAPLVGPGLLRLHGAAPVGPVLHGGLARRTGGDLDGRGRDLRREHRGRVHRLHLAAELRRRVDRGECQGRDERGRDRLVLQRPQLRPDVRPSHHAPAGPGRDPRRRPHRAGANAWRRSADRAEADGAARATRSERHDRRPTPRTVTTPASGWFTSTSSRSWCLRSWRFPSS